MQRLVLLALLLTLTPGCVDSLAVPEIEVPSIPDALPEGIPPAVGNDTDQFGFAVTAQAFAFDQDYALTFTADASTVGLTVVGYAGGTATLEILDEEGTVLYARDLAQNVAEGTQTVTGRPAHAVLRFEDYTGIVSIGVNGD